MSLTPSPAHPDLLTIVPAGASGLDALLLAASLQRSAPGYGGRLLVGEPVPEAAWEEGSPRRPGAMAAPVREALAGCGAEVVDFPVRHGSGRDATLAGFEALALMPDGAAVLLVEPRTLVVGPLDRIDLSAAPAAAAMRQGPAWPEEPAYGPSTAAIWRAVYAAFGLDIGPTLDGDRPDWDDALHFLSLDAGWVFAPQAAVLGQRLLDWGAALRRDPPDALACQSLDALDRALLPAVIHSLGGGRPGPAFDGLDGALTWRWHGLPQAYARGTAAQLAVLEEVAALKPVRQVLREWAPARELIYRNGGRRRVRPLAEAMTRASDKALRQALKRAELWLD